LPFAIFIYVFWGARIAEQTTTIPNIKTSPKFMGDLQLGFRFADWKGGIWLHLSRVNKIEVIVSVLKRGSVRYEGIVG
jgi:hypothetical protein